MREENKETHCLSGSMRHTAAAMIIVCVQRMDLVAHTAHRTESHRYEYSCRMLIHALMCAAIEECFCSIFIINSPHNDVFVRLCVNKPTQTDKNGV